MSSRAAFVILLAVVGASRLIELAISKRNERALRARGGRDTGPGVFGLLVVLHTLLFVAPLVEVFALDRPFVPEVGIPSLVALAAATAIRLHVIAVLGVSWNSRALVAPDTEICDRGLYRWIRHPNYLGLLVEVPALPLVHGAWISALALGLANVPLLVARIRREEAALFAVPGYAEKMGPKARLIPGVI